jgi:mono/diheme cytochrome c family protein
MSEDARRRSLLIAAAAGAVAVAALAAMVVVSATRSPELLDQVSAGERIFRAGLDSQGRPIPLVDGLGGMMGGMMMSRGCAGCHGTDGRGRVTPMFQAPDITYRNLTDPRGMLEPSGDRGETFSDEDIRRAVIDGVDPGGKRLRLMPRWQLTDRDWRQLLEYLKTI